MKKITPEETLKKYQISEEEFRKLYVDDEWSLTDFKNKKGIPYKQTQSVLDFLCIKKRDISESKKTQRVKEKNRKSIKDKYGYDVGNISQVPEIQEKKEQTFTKNFGVNNVFKTKEFRENLYETMLNKYGQKSVPNLNGRINPFGIKSLTEEERKSLLAKARKQAQTNWGAMTDEQKNEIIQKRCKGLVCNYSSSLERKIKQGLENLKIKFTSQFWLKKTSYDFCIPSEKIIIEVQGDFWHANPEVYNPDDILNHPNGPIKARDLWEKDERKKLLAENFGNTVIYIWENELKGLNQPETMKLLIEKIYENQVNKNSNEEVKDV